MSRESKNFSQKGIWDDYDKNYDENTSMSDWNPTSRSKNMDDRFKSPPVIPENKRIMSMSNTRNGNASFQNSGRIQLKSISLKKSKIYFK